MCVCASVNKSSVVERGRGIGHWFLNSNGNIYLSATSDSVSIIALYFGSIMVMVAFR